MGSGTRVRLLEPTDGMVDSGTDVIVVKTYYYEYDEWWVTVTGGPNYGAKLLGRRACVLVEETGG